MENNKKVNIITRTAMLLVLMLVFQNLRLVIGPGLHSQFIIGSLVNAVLIVATAMVGIYPALLISIIAPVVSFFQGHLPQALPFMIPIVAVGNALIVVVYGALKNRNEYIAIVAGAIVKWGFLFYAVKLMLNIVKGNIPEQMFGKLSTLLSAAFSWPQLVTALIGGLIAIIVIRMLKKAV